MIRRTLWLTALVMLSGCPSGDTSKTEASPQLTVTTQKPQPNPQLRHGTGAFHFDFKLSARVEALAKHRGIESSHIGAAGAKSDVYRAYEDVVTVASNQQIVSLLAHESAVVRGYMAGHIARHQPRDLPAIYSTLRDTETVGVLEGCKASVDSVGRYTLEASCTGFQLAQDNETKQQIGRFIQTVAKDQTLAEELRDAAQGCLTLFAE